VWVQEVVGVADAEVQQESSVVFLEILQRGLVPLHSYTDTFLQTIINCVDNKDPGIHPPVTYQQITVTVLRGVCLFVCSYLCLSLCSGYPKTAWLNFTSFLCLLPYMGVAQSSADAAMCTSGFVDNVTLYS